MQIDDKLGLDSNITKNHLNMFPEIADFFF